MMKYVFSSRGIISWDDDADGPWLTVYTVTRISGDAEVIRSLQVGYHGHSIGERLTGDRQTDEVSCEQLPDGSVVVVMQFAEVQFSVDQPDDHAIQLARMFGIRVTRAQDGPQWTFRSLKRGTPLFADIRPQRTGSTELTAVKRLVAKHTRDGVRCAQWDPIAA